MNVDNSWNGGVTCCVGVFGLLALVIVVNRLAASIKENRLRKKLKRESERREREALQPRPLSDLDRVLAWRPPRNAPKPTKKSSKDEYYPDYDGDDEEDAR